MQIKIGFTTKTTVSVCPKVSIDIDNIQMIDTLDLDACGSADDPDAKIQYVTLETDIIDHLPGDHCICITGLNLFNEYKTHGDFGVQVRYIEINQVNLDYFGKNLIAYNPIQDLGYITNYLEPEQRTHELVYIDGKPVHRAQGKYANYINLKDGFIEFHFKTPLYQWLFDQDFGQLTSSLLSDFDN